MSKRRRNHRIPRFLLNRFASRMERPKHWVWQISRDLGAQELSTRDVAVSGSFYGERSDGVADALEAVERRFAARLTGIDNGQTLETFANDLRHFIWTMAVRTGRYVRSFVAAVDLLLEGLSAWSDTTDAGAAAIQQLGACFDEEAEKVIRKLPPHEQRLAASAIRSAVIRSLMLDLLQAAGPVESPVDLDRDQSWAFAHALAVLADFLLGLAALEHRRGVTVFAAGEAGHPGVPAEDDR